MAKKADHSQINAYQLQIYCEANNLQFTWKNQAQGHAVVSSDDIEVYVWVQRMTVQVRRRGGIDLSGSVATHMQNKVFSAPDFTKLIQLGKKTKARKSKPKLKPLVPHFKRLSRLGGLGVVSLRIPRGTPPAEAQAALKAQRDMAKKICLQHEKDHWYEKGWA